MKRSFFLTCLILFFLSASARDSTSFPIAPFGDTLFYIKGQLGSYTPGERAAAINERIRKLSEELSFTPDSIIFRNEDFGYAISYRDRTLMTVLPGDTAGSGMDLSTLAGAYAAKIKSRMMIYKQQWEIRSLIINILLALAAIVFFILLIRYINKGHSALRKKIVQWQGTKIKSLKIQEYEFLNPERISSILFVVLKVIRAFIILLSFYLLLPVLFSIFPFTERWAATLFEYIYDPFRNIIIAFVHYIPNLIRIAIVYIITAYVLKGFKYLAGEVESGALRLPGFYSDWARPTYNIIRVLLYAFMLVVIFPYLPGSDSPAFQGVSVFLGVLLSLGSSSAISNMISGLVITYMRPFKAGDVVKIGEIRGKIIDKNLLVTRIRTIKNEEVSIPNATVMSGHTINYSKLASEAGLILHTTVTIGYDAPWRTVHELLIKAALKTEQVLEDPAPFVLQTGLDDFYVSYQINAYTHSDHAMAKIYSELHQNIQDAFNEGGVEIMSPHYRSLRDGNTTSIPEDYRPADYKPDGFSIKKES